jgi:iron complex outermembrane receptor protein
MNNYPNVGQRKLIVALIASVLAPQAFAQQKSDEIPEVVVTAQKRSESASRTPIALTALTGEDLANRGVQSAADLTNVTPNVQIGTADGGNTNIYIRGIGSNNTTEAGDPAAAFHLDGVYLARPDEARAAFFDISRIEVLRGPQGTLYGRNATAGAVNVITAKPEDAFGGKLSLELGSYRQRRAEAMLNIPVNEALALRVAVMGEHHDNYVGNQTTNNSQNTMAGRIHALLKISPASTLLLSADRTQINGPDNPGVPLPVAAARGAAGQYNADSLASDARATYSGVSAEWNYDLGAATFTYLGAHRTKSKENTAIDLGGFGASASSGFNETSQNSHELRLSSNAGGAWKWVGGLYFFNETQEAYSAFGNGVLVSYTPAFESKSQAAFGQATYALNDALRLTAGLRATRDEKHNHDSTSTFTLFGPPVTSLTNADKSWSNTDGKLGIDYEVSKGTMLYATATTAYKAGGFNSANAAASLPVTYYNPEQLRALEAGVKTRFWGSKGQFNASVFHYSYKDLQVGTIVSVGGGAGVSTVNNAASATINGMEADVKVKVGSDGRFDAAVAYTDATYDTFQGCIYEPTTAVEDCSGNALRNAPKATLSLGYEHQVALDWGNLVLRADTRFSSKYYNDDTNSALFRQAGYHKTDVSVRYNAPDYKWYMTAYVRNLENRNVMASRYPAVVGSSYGYMAAPRTMGVSVGTSF